MTDATVRWVMSGLVFLADWSVRWGVLIAILAIVLALRPPRRPATRYGLCLAALVAGIALPLVPRWLDAPAPAGWFVREAAIAARQDTGAVPRNPQPRSEVLRDQAQAWRKAGSQAQQPRGGLVDKAVPPRAPDAQPAHAIRRPMVKPWQWLALTLAALWTALAVVLLARFAAGRLILSRLKRESAPLGFESQRRLAECREIVGLGRPVVLASHAAVASPVTLGGIRPVILVPADWGAWPAAHQKACLLHELAHLAHSDDWFKLVQELVRVPLFFHPLVRWLLARLDRERELVCDDDVLALGTDRVDYARLLVDLARRPGRLLPAARAFRPGWLTFLDRGTVVVRVSRLLEDDMPRTVATPSLRRRVGFAGAVLAVAIGLGGLNLHVQAVEKPSDKKQANDQALKAQKGVANSAAPVREAEARQPQKRVIDAEILDPVGKPVADATVVACLEGMEKPYHEVLRTDAKGRFHWDVPKGRYAPYIVIQKEGFAPAIWMSSYLVHPSEEGLQEWRLGKAERFEGIIVDKDDKPVAGATVRIELIAHSSESKRPGGSTVSTGFTHIKHEVLEGSPLEHLFVATTDERGAVVFENLWPESWLRLAVKDASGRSLRVRPSKPTTGLIGKMMDESGFVRAPAGQGTRLTALPAAKVAGRVVSKLPNVDQKSLTASFQASRDPGHRTYESNFGGRQKVDREGHFVLDDLNEGAVNVFVHGPGEGSEWTYRAAENVALKFGETAEVSIELIRGIEVEGKVVVQGSTEPVAGAEVAVYGPFRPRSSSMTKGFTTDAEGRYHLRLPSGETYLYVMNTPSEFTRLPENGSSTTVTIPEGVNRYEAPPLVVAPAVELKGRVIDASGAPVASAKVVGLCEGGLCSPFPGPIATTDARGEFRLPQLLSSTIAADKPARLQIQLKDGSVHEANALPVKKGIVTVKLAALLEKPAAAEGPKSVAPDELTGVVVDAQGKPIEGVEAHAWHWVPGHVTRTDKNGVFRLTNMPKNQQVEVRFRKEGYETQFHLDKALGQPGWVVVLGNTTYFEGRLLAPDGSPVAGGLIRANSGPRRGQGFVLTECETETTSGKDGRYRLYVEPGQYDVEVRVPGAGVARMPSEGIAADQVIAKDIKLAPGITFVARFVDHETGKPVEGVHLFHWQKQGIEGTSQADGAVTIQDVPPGNYPRFQVEAKGYARWWSDACLSEWSRFQKDARHGFQRNFDGLDFDITPAKNHVTVELQRAAIVRGRVLDPEGNPVAGATVAPALTGTGNSLTGDTRFSVPTDAQGNFTMLLPASGEREYNLVAHDGKYGEWRTWANGVLPPFRTKPGQEIEGVALRLTRPATVRGRVLDSGGRPIAGREVRASAADLMENRYYNPTVTTREDGTYELTFIRAGEQAIQVAPFWLEPASAPERTSVTLTLDADQTKEGVDFRVPER